MGGVWEQQGVHWFHLLGSLKHLTIGLIWLVTRGGGVGGVGQGGGQGGQMGGGAPESSVGATRRALVPPFALPQKPNNWSDLAGDEGGEVWGGWAREAGKGGGDGGGAPESSVGSNKACTGSTFLGWSRKTDKGGEMGGGTESSVVPPFGLPKNLRRGGGGPGRRARGRRWGAGTRNQYGQQGVHWFHLLGSLKHLTIGLIWL